MRFKVLPFLFVLVSLLSCKDQETPTGQSTLVEAKYFLSRSASELHSFLSLSGLNLPLEKIQYDVQLYKLTYLTNYKGNKITASGIVILPQTTSSVPMVSFQHGTITRNSEVPSELPLNDESLIFYSALASAGYITVVPDFIGFGSSSDLMHPYYVEDLTASSIEDALRASSEAAKKQKVTFNTHLFLAGYSQGGYVTMAAHKDIQLNGLQGFDLIASFPAAGGYDIKGVQEYFFDQTTYDEPYYLAYVAQAYKVTYDWDEPLSAMFSEPYAGRIPGLFDGTKSGGQINGQLTTTVADLLTADIRNNIDTNPDYAYIVDAFHENSVNDFVPTIPLFMYHGDADTTVPYQNSVSVYNHFISSGASPDVVHLITLPGATHESGVKPYVEDFIPRMLELSK